MVHSDDGSFVLEQVPAGRWAVDASAPGYQKGRAGGISLEEGGTVRGVLIRLARGGSIRGRTIEVRSGQPVLDATVEARLAGGTGAGLGAAREQTDADGHFAGGVRLPHVESMVHRHVAGAPLGRQTPLNPLGLDPFHPFVFLSGTFTRFSDQELLSRYASRHHYVKRVERAADYLAARGYITNEDRQALIAAAGEERLPFSQGDDAATISREKPDVHNDR